MHYSQPVRSTALQQSLIWLWLHLLGCVIKITPTHGEVHMCEAVMKWYETSKSTEKKDTWDHSALGHWFQRSLKTSVKWGEVLILPRKCCNMVCTQCSNWGVAEWSMEHNRCAVCIGKSEKMYPQCSTHISQIFIPVDFPNMFSLNYALHLMMFIEDRNKSFWS